MDKIFDIENERVVINENCLLIPELSVIAEAYGGDINPFCYVHYMTDLNSPYYYSDKDFQSELVYKSFPGNYKPTDKIICDAVNFLYDYRVKRNTIIRLWEAGKAMVDKLADYLLTTEIDDSRESGNITNILRTIEKIDKTIANFTKLEKAKLEQEAATRGNQELGYDL